MSTSDSELLERLSDLYRTFAEVEARGVSPLYEQLALFVSQSPEILTFIASVPADRRQPNLFLAAVRHVSGVPKNGDDLIAIVCDRPQAVRQIMLTRTTQTNEPARCAVLLPVLAQLPQPLALLEIGASAGLCLISERYGYNYGRLSLRPQAGPSAPVFPCDASDNTPLPSELPKVVWRAGLDLNPMDVGSADDTAWLETLVWPEQKKRAERLRAAIRIAQADPPIVHRGDLLKDLEPLMETAPRDATLVVFHTSVLTYVADQALRDRFAERMMASTAVWVANESPNVFPSSASGLLAPGPVGRFLLSVNGMPVAWTAPHGQSIAWFGDPVLQP